jgi:O-antigen/teichoic acid export membrane protein
MIESVKNAINVILSKFSTYLINFIVSVIISRELGPEGRGIYASIIFLPSLMLSLGELGITQSIVYHHGRKIIPKQILFSSVLSLISTLSVILISICLILYNTYYAKDFQISWQLIAILQIPISLFLRMSGGFFLGEGKIGVYNKISWIPALINLILSFVLLTLFKFGISGALSAWILSQLLIVSYGIKKISANYSFSFKGANFRTTITLLKMGIVYAISLFIIQANYRIDIFVLKKLVSYEDIGNYSIGISLSEILWQIPTSIGLVILSKTATSFSEKQKYVIAKAIRVSLLLLAFICTIMYFIMPYFIEIIYGKSFLRSISINRILLIGVLIFTFFKIVNSRFAGLGKPYYAIIIFTPCIALKILGNILLVPKYGIEGAAWAANISYIIGGTAMLILFSKTEKISIKEIFIFKKDDFKEIIQLVNAFIKK